MAKRYIHIEGVRQHNLKNLTLDIPRDELVIICGPSGSGKSTLAFDLIYAEGQRRYVESLSTYARQFLPQLDKPEVDKIEGLSPAISLEQQGTSKNPRSTVGTVTEIYDFLRVFYARLGQVFCPVCDIPVKSQTSDEILEAIEKLPEGTKFMLMAPISIQKKGSHAEVFLKLKKQGFARVRINNEIILLDSLPELAKNKRYNIELVVDRLVMKAGIHKRLADSVELTLQYGEGKILLGIIGGEDKLYSTESICPKCQMNLMSPSPQLFSFNSPQGACNKCSGLGTVEYFEPKLIVPNIGLSLNEGAVIPWKNSQYFEKYLPILRLLGEKYIFNLDTPLRNYSIAANKAIFYGDSEITWPGIVNILAQGFRGGQIWRDELARFRQTTVCPECNGARLKPEALSVKIFGISIYTLCSWSIRNSLKWFEKCKFDKTQEKIALPLLKELISRLEFLRDVGIDYISLHRNMSSLSGGEGQRIRLASQIGSGLVGVTYVLDEPSIGLHPQDNERLIKSLRNLQERGNTVLVVEHDEATILSADYILELGPGSGVQGGEIMFAGTVKKLLADKNSLTAKYLRGDLQITIPEVFRKYDKKIVLKNVTTNNLQNINCEIPLNSLVCVTGVSGSGKSSLIIDSLYKHLALAEGFKVDNPGQIGGISGAEYIEKIILIDQNPIGRTPRSNPATYTKIFDDIRKVFAETKDAKMRGYNAGRFSFNVRGGRCEACQGDGQIRVEMHFLPDIFISCEICAGKRYNKETLDIFYREKNINDVLKMTVSEAREFFTQPALLRKLDVLEEVGLGYIQLGQASTTLSGGESQRVKLSRELGKVRMPNTLYILDEPTTGLHMHEVGKLIQVLQKLVDKGASVIVIEHNLDVVRTSDYVIDLGPGGGELGGKIVAKGTPQEIKKNKKSVTGPFL